jgi:nitrite reductase/ring-hydroxylating ferredoxin subunit
MNRRAASPQPRLVHGDDSSTFSIVRRIRIASASSVSEGSTQKFQFVRDGKTVAGFIARVQGRLVAYENVCRHLPVSLDYDDNRFFTEDGAHFICQTHGAIYEPARGLCVRGPCAGAKLKPLPIRVSKGQIWLEL